MLHLVGDERFDVLEFRSGNLEHQLIVHLEQHFGVEGASDERLVNANHRNLDEVRRRALDWGVRGGAFTKCADVEVPVAQLGDIASPVENGLDVSVFPREFDHRIQVFANAMIALEIAFDEFLRLGVGNLELARQGVRALAVDRCEVDRLGARAHLFGDLLDGNVEDQRRGLTVYVAAGAERLDERGIVGEVRKESQLDLRIIGGDERPAAPRNEAAANVATELTPNRNVLEVRLTRRQTSRGRGRLTERRVNAPRARMNVRRQ